MCDGRSRQRASGASALQGSKSLGENCGLRWAGISAHGAEVGWPQSPSFRSLSHLEVGLKKKKLGHATAGLCHGPSLSLFGFFGLTETDADFSLSTTARHMVQIQLPSIPEGKRSSVLLKRRGQAPNAFGYKLSQLRSFLESEGKKKGWGCDSAEVECLSGAHKAPGSVDMVKAGEPKSEAVLSCTGSHSLSYKSGAWGEPDMHLYDMGKQVVWG